MVLYSLVLLGCIAGVQSSVSCFDEKCGAICSVGDIEGLCDKSKDCIAGAKVEQLGCDAPTTPTATGAPTTTEAPTKPCEGIWCGTLPHRKPPCDNKKCGAECFLGSHPIFGSCSKKGFCILEANNQTDPSCDVVTPPATTTAAPMTPTATGAPATTDECETCGQRCGTRSFLPNFPLRRRASTVPGPRLWCNKENKCEEMRFAPSDCPATTAPPTATGAPIVTPKTTAAPSVCKLCGQRCNLPLPPPSSGDPIQRGRCNWEGQCTPGPLDKRCRAASDLSAHTGMKTLP